MRFATAEASAGAQAAQCLGYGTGRVLALTQQCFDGLCNNPRCGSVLVSTSEVAAATGRRLWTGLVLAWGLVWFLSAAPASQFRAGRSWSRTKPVVVGVLHLAAVR